MRIWSLGVWCSLLVCGACADAVPPLTFDIRALTTAGTNPFDGDNEFDRVRIRVQQEGSEVVNLESPVSGTFDLSTSFESLSAPTRVRLELEGETDLHGAPPIFAPGASQGVVRFAVGVPSTCERVDGFDRETREGASYARIDTFILGAGGDGSDSVWIFDLLRLATTELEPLPSAGATTSTRLGSSSALIVGEIVGEDAAAYRYDLSVNPDRDTRVAALMLHEGANETTALLTRSNGGALAVGPGEGFSLVAPDGRVISGTMDEERTRPALVEIGGSLLIIGGNTQGALFEVVDVDRAETTPMGDAVLPSSVAALHVDDGVWLLHADGTTSVLTGCPSCDVRPGDDVIPGVGGARHVAIDGMLFSVDAGSDGPSRQPFASLTEASVPRALFAYESDIVFVADAEGAQLCFPDTLAAL